MEYGVVGLRDENSSFIDLSPSPLSLSYLNSETNEISPKVA